MAKKLGPQAPENHNWCVFNEQWKNTAVCRHCTEPKTRQKRCGHGEDVEKGKDN